MIEQEMKKELKDKMKTIKVKKKIKQQIIAILSTEINPHKLENILRNFFPFKKEISQLNKKRINDTEISECELNNCIEKFKNASPTRITSDFLEQRYNKQKKVA